MFVSKCIFFEGFEVQRGSDCPHERSEDEQGPIMPTGWTVQHS